MRRLRLRRRSGGGGSSSAAGTPQSGGSVIIDRVADSQSMDKTTVFDNESIWVFEQIIEPLYTVTKDGKDVEPWLATSYTLSPDKKTYTFKLRPGVKFSNGQPMTSADVKFSIDAARVEDQGWGFIDVAIKDIEAPDPQHGRDPHEVPVVAAPRRHRALRQRHHPQGLRRQDQEGVLHRTRSAPARSCGTTGTRATSSS